MNELYFINKSINETNHKLQSMKHYNHVFKRVDVIIGQTSIPIVETLMYADRLLHRDAIFRITYFYDTVKKLQYYVC